MEKPAKNEPVALCSSERTPHSPVGPSSSSLGLQILHLVELLQEFLSPDRSHIIESRGVEIPQDLIPPELSSPQNHIRFGWHGAPFLMVNSNYPPRLVRT